MNRAIVATLLVVAVAISPAFARRAPKWHELTPNYTFDQYVEDFGKKAEPQYHNEKELKMRKELFEAELALVMEHNIKSIQGESFYKKGINRYSDWTHEEKKRLRGSKPDMNHQSPFKKPWEPKNGAKPKENYPHTKDYRFNVPAVLSPVKDQGNCGDCWAFAATEAVESSWALATGELFDLSVQQVTSCTPPRGIPYKTGYCYSCNGSQAHYGFDYLAASHAGLTEEFVYSFSSYEGNMPKCMEKEKVTYPSQRFANISHYVTVTPNDEDALVQAINELGPLAVEVAAFPWINYEEGIFTDCRYRNSTMFNQTEPYSLDHAVVLVGYGHDTDFNADYWVIRNSWNPTWGEGGYIRLLRNYHGKDDGGVKPGQPPCGWQYGGTGCFPNNATGHKSWACGCSGIMTLPTFPVAEVGK